MTEMPGSVTACDLARRLAHFDPIDRDAQRAVVGEARVAAGHELGS